MSMNDSNVILSAGVGGINSISKVKCPFAISVAGFLSALKEHFQNVGVEGISSSYAYIVSSDGTMLYHPTAEKIGKSVENAVIKGVVSELKNGQKPENKVVTYDFNGVNKYAAYNISKDQSKIVVISADESEVLQPVNNMMKCCYYRNCITSDYSCITDCTKDGRS